MSSDPSSHVTLTGLLPKGVEIVEMWHDAAHPYLFPEEARYIAGAAPSRRAEFATGRECARRALRALDIDAVPIIPDESRAPRWPEGITGSITHCSGYRAAAVARAEKIASLGIDAETHEPLPDGVLELITVAGEPSMLRNLAAYEPATAWGRILFSAKESIYKNWFPNRRTWLGFTDCEVSINPDGTFYGHLLRARVPNDGQDSREYSGRWSIYGPHLFTAVWSTTPEQ